MGDMQLAAAAWSFRGATLAESAALWRALGIHAMDLIAPPGGLLDSRAIERDPQGQARRVNDVGMEISNIIYMFGGAFDDRPLTSPDPAVRAQNMEAFKPAVEFCQAARIPSILVLPGIDHADVPHADSLKRSADTMNAMAEIASPAGVMLIFEPHMESVLESPVETLAFMQQNPALKIALDYSHFVAQGHAPSDVDPLAPFAGHVHLRQGAKGHLQAEWEKGEIDFPAVIGLLKQHNYRGYVALEYEHDPWLDLVDVMTESILMRDAVAPLL